MDKCQKPKDKCYLCGRKKKMEENNILQEPTMTYSAVSNNNVFSLIEMVRKGIDFAKFFSLVKISPFSLQEWSKFLHISERTMQRYQKEKKTFDAVQSEKIVEIALLYKKGAEVFGSNTNFNIWLESNSLALGNITPKSLLDSSFGINLIKDELIRIEYGVLA